MEPLAGRFVFSFVRNPYARLRSVYLNKIVTAQKQGRFRVQAGFAPDECPMFEDFTLAICAQEPTTQNAHWRPQALNLSVDRIRYDLIGRLEQFETDWNQLTARFPLPRQPAFAGKRTEDTEKAKLAFSPAMIQVIQKAYAPDFDAFGYDLKPPLS